jgi:hypothetical protein
MSWQCARCNELIKEPFDACWNCGTLRTGERDRTFRKADRIKPTDLVHHGTTTMILPPARFQFSIRFLLGLTTLLAIALATGLAVWWRLAVVVLLLAVWTAVGMLLTGIAINCAYGLADVIRNLMRRR